MADLNCIFQALTLGLVGDPHAEASTSQKPLVVVSALIGLVFIAFKILSFVRLLTSLFILPGKPLSSFGPPNSWALVTGASDGIGKEFALQLSRYHFSILLVSRTQSKLDAIAAEIRAHKPSLTTRTFAIDFAHATPAEYARLAATIQELKIAILINNVGASHAIPVSFADTPEREMEDIIAINTLATLRITRLVLPGMLARKCGLILTMGSFAGLVPTPLLATYSGSKAFLQHWSSALGAECEPAGITVHLVQSYLVASAMSKIRRASATVPAPREFVRCVLRKVGRAGGAQGWAYTGTPWWTHAVGEWAVGAVGGFTAGWVVRWNRGMHEEIRRRALRKREREARGGKKGN